MRDAFALDPAVAHLNHGSFGAVPYEVLDAQRRIRDRAEANPMRFHRVEVPELKRQARKVAGEFLDVGADEVALVRNVTQAVATVLGSLVTHGRLTAADAIVLPRQGYEAVRLAVRRCCAIAGCSYHVVDHPIDATADEVVAAFAHTLARVRTHGRRPALVVTDQIASPTGAVLPVARIAAAAHEAGALCLVDAAHVPGQLPARPRELGADYWTGTWHKWGFAPRGTAALWVAESERDRTEPLTTGANHGLPYPLAFDSGGTDDNSGWFCLADAVDLWRRTGGHEHAERARTLLDRGADLVASVLPGPPAHPAATPANPAPCLRLIPLPGGVASTDHGADLLYERLSARRVEVQVVSYARRGYLRLSAAPYNEPADYERLADVLPGLLDGA